MWERYTGPYTEEVKPAVDMMMNKRIAIRLVVKRTRSWDHRKLGMPADAAGGFDRARRKFVTEQGATPLRVAAWG